MFKSFKTISGKKMEERGQWGSQLGFILASTGSAVGLGNVWRFPYLVGENGGAAFVVIYLFFVLVIATPCIFAEFALGRYTQKNPVGAITKIRPGSPFKYVGILGVITGVGILSFYGIISGWIVGFIIKTATKSHMGFTEFVSDPLSVLMLFAFFLLLNVIIVYKGIAGGIERWSKILMPLLFILLVALIIYANTLEGSSEGLIFYLVPDFNKVTSSTFLSALGQAFFSLSLGMGVMITYGSYLPKTSNMFSSAIYIALADTLIAFMAGLIIFPALFAMGENPACGPTLIFVVFPKLFNIMPGGIIVGVVFFILLSIAALTSTISLLEVPVAYFVDERKAKRKNIIWWVSGAAFLLGIPSALSQGSSEFFTKFGLFPSYLCSADFLSQISFLFGDLSLVIGSFLGTIFIGWVWGAKNAAAELEIGSPYFKYFKLPWVYLIRYFIPVVIFLIFLNLFRIF